MEIRNELERQMNCPPYSTENERQAFRDGVLTVFEVLLNAERGDMLKAWYSGISDYRNRKD